jgi:hypothetical protein
VRELMLPGPFGSTTIDCCACVEKANTHGGDRRNRNAVAIEPVSTTAADISNDRHWAVTFVCHYRRSFRPKARSSRVRILGLHCRSLAVIGSREHFDLQSRCQAGRTNESAPIPGRSQIASSQVFRRRAWSGGPPPLCWNSRSGSPEVSWPLGSRARGRCAGARSRGWHP